MSNSGINKDMSRHPLGGLEWLADGSARLVFVREYAHPTYRVWAAITDPGETVRWWAAARGKAEVGSEFSLKWLNGGDNELEWWHGEVLRCDPPRLFEHSNSQHGLLRWELESAVVGGKEDGTRLTFINVVAAPGDTVSMGLAGWHVHLDHLQEALEGKDVDWPAWHQDFLPAWEKIHQGYALKYPDATTAESPEELQERIRRSQSEASDTI